MEKFIQYQWEYGKKPSINKISDALINKIPENSIPIVFPIMCDRNGRSSALLTVNSLIDHINLKGYDKQSEVIKPKDMGRTRLDPQIKWDYIDLSDININNFQGSIDDIIKVLALIMHFPGLLLCMDDDLNVPGFVDSRRLKSLSCSVNKETKIFKIIVNSSLIGNYLSH
jgi:hypothetical protein